MYINAYKEKKRAYSQEIQLFSDSSYRIISTN